MVAVAVDYSIDKVCFGLEKWEEIQVRICGQMIYVYTDFAQYTVRYLYLTYISGWWFQIFLFSPLFGEDSHFD